MDVSQSVVEKFRQKYPASKRPRFNPHAVQQRVRQKREQFEKDMQVLGWDESQLSQMQAITPREAMAE